MTMYLNSIVNSGNYLKRLGKKHQNIRVQSSFGVNGSDILGAIVPTILVAIGFSATF